MSPPPQHRYHPQLELQSVFLLAGLDTLHQHHLCLVVPAELHSGWHHVVQLMSTKLVGVQSCCNNNNNIILHSFHWGQLKFLVEWEFQIFEGWLEKLIFVFSKICAQDTDMGERSPIDVIVMFIGFNAVKPVPYKCKVYKDGLPRSWFQTGHKMLTFFRS